MKRGFTLVEIILYVGTLAIVLTSLSAFLLYILDSKTKHIVMSDVEQQGSFVLTQISQAIRNAEDVNSPVIGATDTQLSLDVVDTANDPTVYNLSGNTLQITQGTGSAVSLTSEKVEVTDLVFTYAGNGLGQKLVKIEFTLNYINPDQKSIFQYEKDFQTTVALR